MGKLSSSCVAMSLLVWVVMFQFNMQSSLYGAPFFYT